MTPWRGPDHSDLEAFAHVVAHDLRAPLRGISVHLRLLERDLAEHDGAGERIGIMQDRLRQMDAMLQRLRDFSKLMAADGEPEPLDMPSLVAECWERAGADSHGLAVEGEATWEAPPMLVVTVLEELLRNAHQHDDRDGGTIRVTVAPGRLCIEDEGPGLPGEAERLVEPFSKAGATGTGAGLALVRHVMRRLDGDLELTRLQRGTRACITWPA